MAGDRAWGCMMSSMLPSDGDLGILWEHGLTSGQTMYPLFLKRYGHNQLFVIGLGWKGHYAQSDTIHWMNLRQPKPRNSWTVTHIWQVPLQWSLGWTSLNMLGADRFKFLYRWARAGALYWEMLGQGEFRAARALYRDPPPSWTDRMTDTTENITFPQLLWRAVIMKVR